MLGPLRGEGCLRKPGEANSFAICLQKFRGRLFAQARRLLCCVGLRNAEPLPQGRANNLHALAAPEHLKLTQTDRLINSSQASRPDAGIVQLARRTSRVEKWLNVLGAGHTKLPDVNGAMAG